MIDEAVPDQQMDQRQRADPIQFSAERECGLTCAGITVVTWRWLALQSCVSDGGRQADTGEYFKGLPSSSRLSSRVSVNMLGITTGAKDTMLKLRRLRMRSSQEPVVGRRLPRTASSPSCPAALEIDRQPISMACSWWSATTSSGLEKSKLRLRTCGMCRASHASTASARGTAFGPPMLTSS